MELLINAGWVTLLCCVTMFITWLIAMKLDNYSIVDVTWSYNFPLSALLLYIISDGWGPRKLLITLCVCAWGIRLGTHLLVRILGHLHQEDGRYQELRKRYGKKLKGEFLSFYGMQAASNVFLVLPFLAMTANNTPEFSVVEYAGAAFWFLAFLGETVADRQLASFKKDPKNKGKVCNVGLWSWSRHPNYFFESMIWVGYALMAAASPYGWLAWLCAGSILFLLLKVTGVPMSEEQSLRSRGDAYRAYQKTTSKFIPLPPKGN
ncbi:MAG: DUF1295 domain-containing protein [Bacteroidota bacterium]